MEEERIYLPVKDAHIVKIADRYILELELEGGYKLVADVSKEDVADLLWRWYCEQD